jgi:hypothetical protein
VSLAAAHAVEHYEIARYGTLTLGDRVRAASNNRAPWPTISVWHGSRDPIVKPSNGEDIIRQWIDVHGLSKTRFA